MKIFYGFLVAIYALWFVWYGGSGQPMTQAQVDEYIEIYKSKSHADAVRQQETLTLIERLAAFDTGNEYLMVNLIRYRAQAKYPADSAWANETDALAADARYSQGVVVELLKRGGIPLLKGNAIGVFMVDADWHDWDDFAVVRYRSAEDMLDMMMAMADTGLAEHKYASIEQTHVFPVEPVISLFFVRSLLALLLFAIAMLMRGVVLRKG